jgi:O-antigen ligase
MITAHPIVAAGSKSSAAGTKLYPVVTGKPVPKLVRTTFLVFVFTIPFQGLDLPVVTSSTFSLAKLSGMIFFVCYFCTMGLPLRKPSLGIPTPMWLFLVYFGLYIVSGLFLRDEGVRSYIMRMFTLAQLIVFCWLAADLMRREELAKRSLLTFAVGCAIVAAGSLFHLPGFSPEVTADRSTAFDYNPNYFALLMAYGAAIIIGFSMFDTTLSRIRKFILLSLTLPMLALMVSTGSRAGTGAFVIGISLYFFPYKGSRKKVFAFVLALVSLLGVVYGVMRDPVTSDRWSRFVEEGEVAGRADIYAAALEMVAERPVLGWGGKTANLELGSRLGLPNRGTHNLILQLLIEVGIVGTVPFMIGVGLCAVATWRARKGMLGLVPLALLTMYLANSMTHTALTQKTTWLIFAISLAAAAASKSNQWWAVITASGRINLVHGSSFRPGTPPADNYRLPV